MNKRVSAGIESLLPEKALQASTIFDERTKLEPNGTEVTTTRTLNKMALCAHVCEAHRDPYDFRGFSSLLDMLEEVCSLSASRTGIKLNDDKLEGQAN